MKSRFFQDKWVPALALALSFLGLVFIYDAGIPLATSPSGAPGEFFRQAMYLGAAVIAYWAVILLGSRHLRSLSWMYVSLVFAGLLAVSIGPFSHTVGGSSRWIGIGQLRFQPSEFAKLATILLLAALLARLGPLRPLRRRPENWGAQLDVLFGRSLRWLWPTLAALVVPAAVILERDMGTGVISLCCIFVMLLVWGLQKRWVFATIVVGVMAMGFFAQHESYRSDRISSFLDRWSEANTYSIAYQTTEAEIGVARGGWFGQGLANGNAKHRLPVPTSDFIMVTVAEETGLIGATGLILLLGALVWRLLRLAERAPDAFGKLVVGGVATWITSQSFLNIVVANGSIPAVGIPLPFVSSGGSSLLALSIALAVCEMVSRPYVMRRKESSDEFAHDGRRHGRARVPGDRSRPRVPV